MWLRVHPNSSTSSKMIIIDFDKKNSKMIRPKCIRPIGILLTQLGPIQANYEGPGTLVIQLYDVDKGWWLRKT